MGSFDSFDGLSLYYEIIGGGSPVVLLHGFGSSFDHSWKASGVVSALSASGRSVIGLDARGHGHSSKPHDPGAYGNDAMAKDVSALFDHLSLEAADVVGGSMGAGTALRFAMNDSRVRRLVLAGINLEMARHQWGEPSPGWDERLDESFQKIVEALEAADLSSIADGSAKGFRSFVDGIGADPKALAAIVRSGGPTALATGGAVSSVKVPTLVINGDADVSPESLADVLPDGRAATVTGDHLTAVDDPAFARTIVEFLVQAP